MRRREFISLLGGAAVAWPLAARAQRAGKLPTIGFLGAATASDWSNWVAAFVQRLRELGWVEGHTVTIEYRWAQASRERAAEIAAEFVGLKVDVIVASGGMLVAAKQATSVIPIVFALANDPVASGFVASLARPGGNVTGLSLQAPDLAGKRIELLREMVPGVRRLAVLANIGNPGNAVEMGEVRAAARTLGVEVVSLEIRRPEDIARTFDGLAAHTDALYVCSDPLIYNHRTRVHTLVLGARLPMIVGVREHAEAGALASYGTNVMDLFRRAAEYVDRILRGAKPADLPVAQPTKFDLVINLITAKALGLTVPPTLLARADEVIE